MHIIGGGVIGLCCAWYLRKAGFEVTVIDKTDMQDGCSFGNAGIIVPSHFVPLASPGVVTRGIRWMFRRDSPFFIQLQPDLRLLQWMWRFYQSCNKTHVSNAMPLLRDFHLLSKSLYAELNQDNRLDFDFEARGNLMLYRSSEGRAEEAGNAERAHALNLQVQELSATEVARLLPGIRCDVLGGYYYPDDAHLYPGKFILAIQDALEEDGVRFLRERTVTGFRTSQDRVTDILLDNGERKSVDDVVFAAGAWTSNLAGMLGVRLLIQDGKGYSVTLKNADQRPEIPVILTEARVAVTPMGGDLRIGGTLEVSQFSPKINKPRVDAILGAMNTYFPSIPPLHQDKLSIWYGYRPVSADGLPYIGRPHKYSNVIVAAGHAMLGMSLGPATGLLVSEIAQGRNPSLPTDLLSPDRH